MSANLTYCPHCGTPASAPRILKCWNCQAEIEGEARYCPSCAVPLDRGVRADPGVASARYAAKPGRPSLVTVVLLVLVIVLASLMVTGYGDSLMGRHWWSGASPPYTNVTVVGINETYVLNAPGQSSPLTGSISQMSPRGAVFLSPGASGTYVLIFYDSYSNATVTYVSITVGQPFSSQGVSPALPVTIQPGQSLQVFLHFKAPSQPGLYVMQDTLVGDVG